jgi:glycosyltransferase involved in cell wall biosynthesis
VRRLLQRAGIFLATSVGEEFGLPALEAMAAGCVVVSVPVKGGLEFLRDGENCVVAEPARLAEALLAIAAPARASRRALLRHRAVATAARYRSSRQRERLRSLLGAELEVLAG